MLHPLLLAIALLVFAPLIHGQASAHHRQRRWQIGEFGVGGEVTSPRRQSTR